MNVKEIIDQLCVSDQQLLNSYIIVYLFADSRDFEKMQ